LVALMEKEKRSAGKPGERDRANHRNREDELNPIASSPKPSPSKWKTQTKKHNAPGRMKGH
jgi:hypothetical protein